MAAPRGLELTLRGAGGEQSLGKKKRRVTRAELARHGPDSGDAWIRVGADVVSVQGYLGAHPGGRQAILEFAGQDATGAFNVVRHSRAALEELRALVVGTFSDDDDGAPPAVDVEVAAPPAWSAAAWAAAAWAAAAATLATAAASLAVM